MSAPFLNNIDWTRPWLMPLLPIAQPILQAADWRQALNVAASLQRNHRGLPIRFVPQAELPPGVSYEAYISDTGRVPTRDNLHDFFNALVWLTFPKIKAQLNALQAAEIEKASIGLPDTATPASGRGKVRDAATIFDENAALLITSDPQIVEALRNHEWRHVFVTRRDVFLHHCEVHLFGHAVMEKLVSPYKAITAHAWIVDTNDGFFIKTPAEKRIWLDEQVSKRMIYDASISSFTPLPVLGVPGWWENNKTEVFYDDAAVFRHKRRFKK